jgi:hypothetical protein
LIQKSNVVYLDTGGWLIRDGKKHCHACGRVYIFKPPKRSFDQLVAQAEKQEGGLFVS